MKLSYTYARMVHESEMKVHGERKPSLSQAECQYVSSLLSLLGTTVTVCTFVHNKACRDRNADLANLAVSLLRLVVWTSGLQACVIPLMSESIKSTLYNAIADSSTALFVRMALLIVFLLGVVLIVADPIESEDATEIVMLLFLLMCDAVGMFRYSAICTHHLHVARAVFGFTDTVQLFAVLCLAYAAMVIDVDRTVLPCVAILSTFVSVLDNHVALPRGRAHVLWGVLWSVQILLVGQSLLLRICG